MKGQPDKPASDRISARRSFSIEPQHPSALLLWVASLILFWPALAGLANLALRDENSSQVLLIPLISSFLICWQRKRIFEGPKYSPAFGAPLLLAAAILWFALQVPISKLNHTDGLSVSATIVYVAWIGIFILCYGRACFKAALFPLLYLLLMIPLPAAVSERLIGLLQTGSANVCFLLFRSLGVPVIRHGFQFSLPGVDIEVARQCSGIHSALSLFIAGLLAGQFVLEGNWRKVCFALCIFPIAILKNAVRIVALAWIGVYVNPAVFQSALHRQGGLPFSLIAVAIMGTLLWLLRSPLRRFERIHARMPGEPKKDAKLRV